MNKLATKANNPLFIVGLQIKKNIFNYFKSFLALEYF